METMESPEAVDTTALRRSAPGGGMAGVPVPPEPYPRVNSRENMNARIAQQTQQVRAAPPTTEQMAAMSQARLEGMREMAFPTKT